MEIDKEYIKRVLEYGNFGGEITIDEYYVRTHYPTFSILLRLGSISIDFWVQTDIAYVPVSLPLPAVKSAYLSKAIRWIFAKLLAELIEETMGGKLS